MQRLGHFRKKLEMRNCHKPSYVLRNRLLDNKNCLGRKMNEYCNEMWQRLEERFGYEGKIVEVLLNGIMHY